MSPESGDGIRPPSLESGQPDSGNQSDRNPADRPDLAREPDFGRIWPDPANLPGSGQMAGIRRNCPDFGLYLEFWLY
jgi:hypothetical protein